MDAEEILARYKYQPMLEKRFEQLKTAYGVMTVLFKSVKRVEGFLFLYFIAMITQSPIERDVRIAMKNHKMKSIPLYSEERNCFSPTGDRILSEFHNLDVHRKMNNGNVTNIFYTEMTEIQKLILSLLAVSEEDFSPQ
ncbi:Transposase-like protein [mine drainage metagenome]|uniref:Transposase-like protein n=1 Tax=mine drainage metagenome TaxID=410659 RepID=T1C6W6_9ZZZZ